MKQHQQQHFPASSAHHALAAAASNETTSTPRGAFKTGSGQSTAKFCALLAIPMVCCVLFLLVVYDESWKSSERREVHDKIEIVSQLPALSPGPLTGRASENSWLILEVASKSSDKLSRRQEDLALGDQEDGEPLRSLAGLEDVEEGELQDDSNSNNHSAKDDKPHELADDNNNNNNLTETLDDKKILDQISAKSFSNQQQAVISDQKDMNIKLLFQQRQQQPNSTTRRIRRQIVANKGGEEDEEEEEEEEEGAKLKGDRHHHYASGRPKRSRSNPERGKPILNEFSFPANLVQGMRFVLMCQVLDGEPPIQIKWFKDEQELSLGQQFNAIETGPSSNPKSHHEDIEMISNDELGSSLLFRKVRQQHGGNYTCLASNHLGVASYSSSMTVKVPPSWRVEPQDRECTLGEQVTIDCSAAGNPNPFIRWKFAPLNLAEGTKQQQQQAGAAETSNNFRLINSNHHVQTLENGSLAIRLTGREHEGSYACEADNGVEPNLIKLIRLLVHKQAHFFDDISVISSSNSQPLASTTSSSSIASSSSPPAPPGSQAGASASYRIIRLAQNTSSIKFACSPHGDLPLQVDWLKDGHLIHSWTSGASLSGQQQASLSSSAINNNNNHNEEQRFHSATRWLGPQRAHFESELILFGQLARQDAGLYTCQARNSYGLAERKLRLIVQEAPDAPQLVDVARIASRSISLRWLQPFDGNSPIMKYVIEWNKQPSVNKFHHASNNHSDNYHAQWPGAVSSMSSHEQPTTTTTTTTTTLSTFKGRSEKFMPLLVASQQLVPTITGGTDQSSQSLQMPNGASGSAAATTSIQHTVHELEPMSRYSLRVIAVNALGQSRPSVALSLQTEEEVPSTVPNLVSANVLSSRAVKLHWSITYAPEHELIEGFFIGYRSFDNTAPPSAFSAAGGAATSSIVANTLPNQPQDNRPTFTYKTIRLATNVANANDPTVVSGSAAAAAAIGQVELSSPNQGSTILAPIASISKQQQSVSSPPDGSASAGATSGHSVQSQFEYVINSLERNTEYTILIQCFNRKGAGPTSDPVVFKTFATDPPEKLLVSADEISESSVRFNWRFPGERLNQISTLNQLIAGRNDISVDGFVLTYAKLNNQLQQQHNYQRHLKQQQQLQAQNLALSPTQGNMPNSAARIHQPSSGNPNSLSFSAAANLDQLLSEQQWQAIQLAPQLRNHMLKNLECGTWYVMRAWAFNKMGKGEPSDLVTASTKGKAPVAPDRRSFLAINSTQVRLFLSAWYDGGCEIEKFVIQYRARNRQQQQQLEWILVSNNILKEQQTVLIRDLAPATAYEILIGAHNSVGQTEAKYRLTTLDLEGKQVTASSFALLGDSSSELDDDETLSRIDYIDDSGIRREVWLQQHQTQPNQVYGSEGHMLASRWFISALKQFLNSPITLLISLCLFLVLLVLLVYNRYHYSDGSNRNGCSSDNSDSSNSSKGSSSNSNSCMQSGSHGRRCSLDATTATILDGAVSDPPLSVTNGSSLNDVSPARVNMPNGYRTLQLGHHFAGIYGDNSEIGGQHQHQSYAAPLLGCGGTSTTSMSGGPGYCRVLGNQQGNINATTMIDHDKHHETACDRGNNGNNNYAMAGQMGSSGYGYAHGRPMMPNVYATVHRSTTMASNLY